MRRFIKKTTTVFLCLMMTFTSFTAPTNAKDDTYEVQYRSTGEDDQGFTAQLTLANNEKKDIESWKLEFDYNEKIEDTSIYDIRRKETNNTQYRYHYQIQPKADAEIPAKGNIIISYRVDAELNINDNPQNYDFRYTLKPETKKLDVISDRSGGMIRLTWKSDKDSIYTVEKGTSLDELKKQDGSLIYKGTFLETDNDVKQTLYYRVTETKDKKVISQSEIMTLKGYIDSDEDGLSDELEELYGTDKNKVDTDGDGLSDYAEVHTYKTDPLEKDSDEDGIKDGTEIETGLDPLKKDSNDNGILDINEDSDQDGLINKEELFFHSSLIRPDSDGDGLNDKEEKKYGTNPNKQDSDDDGLLDKEEIELGSDPLHPDSNGNGIKDGDEKYMIRKDADVQADDAPALDMKLKGEQIKTLHIEKVSDDDIFLNENIPGWLGGAWEFEVEGEFQQARVSFPYTEKAGEEPRIYYFNEEIQLLEEVADQKVENGKVSADLNHFSRYILLDKKKFDDIWKNDILSPTDGGNASSMDIAFVLDNSGSMAWNDPELLRVELSKEFVGKMQENDRGTVVSFCQYATLMNNLTNDKDNIRNTLDRQPSMPRNGTNVYSGMRSALDELKRKDKGSKKFMFILSDGVDTVNNTYDSILKELKTNKVSVYTLGLGKEMDEELLTRIAAETGGKYFHASTSGEMVDEFDKIVGETIDYTTDSDKDGISDYYEKAINDGKLRLGSGRTIAGKLDIQNDDTDGDGLKDGQEIEVAEVDGKIYVKYDSDPTLMDSDSDGYDDYTEFKNGTSPLGWDVSSRDMAMSASLSYQDLKAGTEVSTLTEYDTDFEEHGSFSEMKGWKVIKSIPDTKTGFSALAIRNKDKIIISYRGTKSQYEDIVQTDIFSWFYTFNQQENETNEFITELMVQYPKDEIYVSGHSLGGNLAYMGGGFGLLLNAERIKKIEVFNAYGLVKTVFPHRYDQIKDNLNAYKGRVKNYSVTGDMVSILPRTDQYGLHIEFPFCWQHFEYNLLWRVNAHNIHSILGSLKVRMI